MELGGKCPWRHEESNARSLSGGDKSAPDILDAHSSSGSSQTTYPCTQTYIDYTYVNCRDWTVPMVTEAMLSNNPHFAETCADHKGDFALSVV